MLGAGADARPAGPRPAPQGPAQRPVGAAEVHADTCLADGDAARAGAWACWARPRRSFRNIVGHAKGVATCRRSSAWTRRAVRPAAVVEGRRVDQGALGRQADPQGHPRCRGCRCGRRQRRRRDHRLQPWRPPARRRAVLDLHAAAASSRRSATKIEVHIDGGIRSGQDVLKAARARREGHLYRPPLPLRPRRHGQGRRDQGARDHPQGDWTSPWRSAASGISRDIDRKRAGKRRLLKPHDVTA